MQYYLFFFSLARGEICSSTWTTPFCFLKKHSTKPPKWKFYNNLLTLMSFQTHLTLFLLNSTQNKFSRYSVLFPTQWKWPQDPWKQQKSSPCDLRAKFWLLQYLCMWKRLVDVCCIFSLWNLFAHVHLQTCCFMISHMTCEDLYADRYHLSQTWRNTSLCSIFE